MSNNKMDFEIKCISSEVLLVNCTREEINSIKRDIEKKFPEFILNVKQVRK